MKEFADSDNAQIKSELSSLQEPAGRQAERLRPALLSAFQGEEGGREKLLEKAGELLAKEPRADRWSLARFSMALSLLEYEDPASAGKLADSLERVVQRSCGCEERSGGDGVRRFGSQADRAHRKEFDLPVKPHDNAEFDWASYRGKVVLVDFWATWCVPVCMSYRISKRPTTPITRRDLKSWA